MFSLEKKEILIQQPALQFKEPEKVESKPKISRRKEIMKIGAEINKIDNRRTIENIHKTKRATKLTNS